MKMTITLKHPGMIDRTYQLDFEPDVLAEYADEGHLKSIRATIRDVAQDASQVAEKVATTLGFFYDSDNEPPMVDVKPQIISKHLKTEEVPF